MGKKGRQRARDLKYAPTNMAVDLARGRDEQIFYRQHPDGTIEVVGDRIDVAIDVVEGLDRLDHAVRQEP